ncbi:AlkA N-terminal domain-containing protein [Yinghuangia seranimata]|uniref:AlkA N-terminal domain-containing protein n=1 Tax=Yinghuangia seranimata TaxID=408067 RepID=UPI00248C5BD6|nr:AlkA N-terminal domain-containing protein [Yinghuangia seranimata]MDI2126486.1 AlkA N-terminal domain-containing protein [Yinghuangia seranimata]
MPDTFTARYQVISSRDARFDGSFYTAVSSTGIYCRPSCPARTPKPENVSFFSTAAAAQAAGFRACKRCRPEASPGSPDWDIRADLVGRALRLIADGVVDEGGVSALARRLAVSERHLHRQMVGEVGTGPLALARMRRAQTARMLLEATDLPITQIAFAAGYASVRQFNESMAEAFGCTPSELRRRRRPTGPGADGEGDIVLRLQHRRPYALDPILGFLGTRAIGGVEEVVPAGTDGAGGMVSYRRSLRLPRRTGIMTVTPHPEAGFATLRLRLEDLRDLTAAVQRCRRLFDLDADPQGVDEVLGADPLLAPLVAARPGLRVPGHVDGFELAVRAVLGQQVTVKGARTLAERIVAKLGCPLASADGTLTHMFPSAEQVAEDDLSGIGLTNARITALRAVARAVADGDVVLDPGADRDETERGLLALPGIGPWTASYIAMRALGDPDAIPVTDLGVRQALRSLGADDEARAATARAEAWRPWRAYAAMHLWTHLSDVVADAPAAESAA